MQLTSTLVLLLSAAGGLIALLSDGPNPAYVEIYREKATNGSLIYLGPSKGSQMVREDVAGLEERLAAPCKLPIFPTCIDSHEARNNLCDELVTELYGDPSILVGQSPRQICYEADAANNFCCVSWSKAVKNLTKGDLSEPANGIMKQCTQNGIAGELPNVMLQHVCTTVCLSDRGTGCS